MEKLCKNCKHFVSRKEGTQGECRWKPPSIFAALCPVRQTWRHATFWPEVSETAWCDQFRDTANPWMKT